MKVTQINSHQSKANSIVFIFALGETGKVFYRFQLAFQSSTKTLTWRYLLESLKLQWARISSVDDVNRDTYKFQIHGWLLWQYGSWLGQKSNSIVFIFSIVSTAKGYHMYPRAIFVQGPSLWTKGGRLPVSEKRLILGKNFHVHSN